MPNQSEVCEAAQSEMSEARAKLISDLKAECEELAQRIEKCQKFVLKVQYHGITNDYVLWCEQQLQHMMSYYGAISRRISILQGYEGEHIVSTLGKIYQR